MIERPLVRGFAPWLGATLLRVGGWKVVLAQPVPARCVVIFYPHTSNWDTAIGLCVTFMIGLPVRFAGKDSLFKVPCLGPLLVRWGGIPVNRREHTGFIEQMTALFRRHGEFRLALGFIDYPRREVGLGAYIDLTGDRANDMARIRAFYADKRGRHPENQGPVCLRDERPAAG